jgi:hypothetical protein
VSCRQGFCRMARCIVLNGASVCAAGMIKVQGGCAEAGTPVQSAVGCMHGAVIADSGRYGIAQPRTLTDARSDPGTDQMNSH